MRAEAPLPPGVHDSPADAVWQSGGMVGPQDILVGESTALVLPREEMSRRRQEALPGMSVWYASMEVPD